MNRCATASLPPTINRDGAGRPRTRSSPCVGLGYAEPQDAAAVARISAALGQEAETAALIRAGLKELAQ